MLPILHTPVQDRIRGECPGPKRRRSSSWPRPRQGLGHSLDRHLGPGISGSG